MMPSDESIVPVDYSTQMVTQYLVNDNHKWVTVLALLQVMTVPYGDDGEEREVVTPTHFTAGKVFIKYK